MSTTGQATCAKSSHLRLSSKLEVIAKLRQGTSAGAFIAQAHTDASGPPRLGVQTAMRLEITFRKIKID